MVKIMPTSCVQLFRYALDLIKSKVRVQKLLMQCMEEILLKLPIPSLKPPLRSGRILLLKAEKIVLVFLSHHEQNLFCEAQTESELSYCSPKCTFWARYLFPASTSSLIVTSERARSPVSLFHLNGNRRWYCLSSYVTLRSLSMRQTQCLLNKTLSGERLASVPKQTKGVGGKH